MNMNFDDLVTMAKEIVTIQELSNELWELLPSYQEAASNIFDMDEDPPSVTEILREAIEILKNR